MYFQLQEDCSLTILGQHVRENKEPPDLTVGTYYLMPSSTVATCAGNHEYCRQGASRWKANNIADMADRKREEGPNLETQVGTCNARFIA